MKSIIVFLGICIMFSAYQPEQAYTSFNDKYFKCLERKHAKGMELAFAFIACEDYKMVAGR